MAAKKPEPKLTAKELAEIDWLSAEEVAQTIGCTADTIRRQARIDNRSLGFPVTVIGSSVLIPKRAFLHYMTYGYTG